MQPLIYQPSRKSSLLTVLQVGDVSVDVTENDVSSAGAIRLRNDDLAWVRDALADCRIVLAPDSAGCNLTRHFGCSLQLSSRLRENSQANLEPEIIRRESTPHY